jgi:hypothetical protein
MRIAPQPITRQHSNVQTTIPDFDSVAKQCLVSRHSKKPVEGIHNLWYSYLSVKWPSPKHTKGLLLSINVRGELAIGTTLLPHGPTWNTLNMPGAGQAYVTFISKYRVRNAYLPQHPLPRLLSSRLRALHLCRCRSNQCLSYRLSKHREAS